MKYKKIITFFLASIFIINFFISSTYIYADELYSKEYIISQEEEFAMNEYMGSGIEDYKYKEGTIPILISAPHTVKQWRNNQYKSADVYTGALVKTLNETTGAHIIYKTTTNGDENYTTEETDYRKKIKDIVESNNIRVVLDLHGMTLEKESDIDIGTGNTYNINLLNQDYIYSSIINSLNSLNHTTNKYFIGGGPYTISTYVSQKIGIPSVQLEINRKFRDTDSENFTYIVEQLSKMIKNINNEPYEIKGLEVSEITTSSVNLSWDSIPGINKYEIYRSKTENGTYSKVAISDNNSYTDSNLKSGETYYYKIKCVDGEFSNVLTVNTICSEPKAKVSASQSKTIKVSWNKVYGANGYELYRSTSKDGKYSKVKTITDGKTLSFDDTKLETGRTYYYKIRAYKTINNKKVYSDYSSVVSTTLKLSKPSVTLSSAYRKIYVKWKKVNDASGYEVYRASSKNGKYSKVKTITKGSTVSYMNSNLASKKKYYYKVRAFKVVSGKKVYSSYSDIKNIKTK
ncbi:MAG: fibronectin type III domain-containing protein [Clostridiales bacterium]|nr:fibronectin type III domain-containing protein [Clostridiales bacterium]